MSQQKVYEVVDRHKPESLELSPEQVSRAIDEAGYKLVQCRVLGSLAPKEGYQVVPKEFGGEYEGKYHHRFDPGEKIVIRWEWEVEGDTITYKPFIPRGDADKLPEDVQVSLFAEAGAQELKVQLDDITFVTMPVPPRNAWILAGENNFRGAQVPLSEGREMALEFVNQLRDMGLID